MYLHSDSALHSMLVSSNNSAKSHEVANNNGYTTTDVMHAARPADHGVKKGDAKFEWFKITNAETPYTMLGVVEHKTIDIMYQKERHIHANTVNRFANIYVAAENDADAKALESKFQKQYDTFIDTADKEHIADNIVIGTVAEYKEHFGVNVDMKRSSYVGLSFICESLDYVKNVIAEKGYKATVSEKKIVIDFTKEMNLFLVFEK